MASGRLPLATNQNAINSPFRGLAPVSGKRTRAQAETTKETIMSQPPSKRQIINVDHHHHDRDENLAPRTLTRQSISVRDADNKLFMKRSGNTPMTAFEKRLVAAKEGRGSTPHQQTVENNSPDASKKPSDSLDNIRQWQRHYRKAFPTFTFYFESVPDEARQKYSRLVQSLGAKEEKFFSKDVTHVVTTRPIPSEKSASRTQLDYHDHGRHDQPHRTIDPSLLDRRGDSGRRTTDILDATLQARQNQNVATHG